MLKNVLDSNHISNIMGGNVGNSAAEIALKHFDIKPSEPLWLLMELSSYQIEGSKTLNTTIGIWTTLTPDHLERHKDINN